MSYNVNQYPYAFNNYNLYQNANNPNSGVTIPEQQQVPANLSFNGSEIKSPSQKYFTTSNIILGSLATLGILGIADIALYKGKHINKITGKNKALEEALERATTAESKVEEATTKAETMKEKLKELESKIETIIEENSTSKKKIEELSKLEISKLNFEEMLKMCQSLWIECEEFGPECAKYIRQGIAKKLRVFGFEVAEISTNKLDTAKYISYEAGAIKGIDMTKPAIIDNTGQIIMKGHCFIPKDMSKAFNEAIKNV